MSKQSRINQARSYARQRALQALYQWELNKQSAAEIVQQFMGTQEMDKVDTEYFAELLSAVIHIWEELDEILADYVDIPVRDMDTIERNILRLCLYELNSHAEVPYRVIINEGVELAKSFGADQGHKFVNGVLDKACKVIRAVEISEGSSLG